jgi:hypothetical protein
VKILLISVLLLSLVSCGKSGSKSSSSVSSLTDASILNRWLNNDVTSPLEELDLTTLTIGVTQPSEDLIDCDGVYGNSGNVNGVAPGMVGSSGDEQTGIINVGHLKYVNSSNPTCQIVSKEVYTYSIHGDVLTWCNANCMSGVYPSCQANPCETYTKI